jgi:transposase-like protein
MKLDYLCDGLNVVSDKQAIEIFRCIRWANGVFCPNCKSFEIVMAGGGCGGKPNRYICKDCDSSFNDFTGTMFHKSKISPGEFFYILFNLNGKTVKQISKELHCSRQSVHRIQKRFSEKTKDQSKNKYNNRTI